MYHREHHRQRQSTAPSTLKKRLSVFGALALAGLASISARADQGVDLGSCISTANNQIEVVEDEAGNPAPSPACLSAQAGSEITWQQASSKDFKIKFVKHSDGQCNDTADFNEQELDSNNGKLKKNAPNRAGCFHYRIKFKGGEWIDPVIVIRPN